jgi:Asp-tRNA(Asn)/Glu-tRNA(Gln) amidotransferase C subunit|tara:strand:- start:502 stop:681 length:180 start_codon:yes stop_codon:yes gene_type:complete
MKRKREEEEEEILIKSFRKVFFFFQTKRRFQTKKVNDTIGPLTDERDDTKKEIKKRETI